MADDTAIREAAQRYMANGWAVIALHGAPAQGICACWKGADCGNSAGKHPIGAGRLGDGWTPPIGSADQLPAGANIGLATGAQSGFFVLDEDPKNGGDARLRELIAQHGPLPVTFTVRTGSGGRHFYFLMSEDFTPTNSRGRLPVGLDIRGEGGQVVAAPSVSGFGSYTVELDVPLTPAPSWLLELIRPLAPIETGALAENPVWAGGGVGVSTRGSAYALSAVQQLTWNLRMAAPGDRNNTAFTVACRLIELAHADWSGLAMEDAWAWYATAGQELVGSDFTAGELRTAWVSALRRVRERPAVLPPPPGGAIETQAMADWGGMPPFSVTGSGVSTAALGPVPGMPDPWETASPGVAVSNDTAVTQVVPAGQQPLREKVIPRSMLSKLPRPVPLIQGTLWRDTDTWLIGASGSGKSFVALDWAAHVATGRQWNNRRVWGGPVLYLAAEGASGIQQRLDAWELAQHKAAAKAAEEGATLPSGPVPDSFAILPEAVQAIVRGAGRAFARSPRWLELEAVVAQDRPVLIVLDTQARLSLGLNENDNAEMGLFIEAVAALRRAAGGACVLVVHHTGRNGGDARGASSIDGAQDVEWKVKRVSGAMAGELVMEKNKNGPDDARHPFELRSWDMGYDSDTGERITSLTVDYDVRVGGRAEDVDYRQDVLPRQHELLQLINEVGQPQGDSPAELEAAIGKLWLPQRRAAGLTSSLATAGGKPLHRKAIGLLLTEYGGEGDKRGLVGMGLVRMVGSPSHPKYAQPERYERYASGEMSPE
ncbi:MAG TPA: AAA family ATPase [Jiangellales bacterium]|nr:AAA family ATPase [Jiangellales bacterium]